MFPTYTNSSGSIVLQDAAIANLIETRIANGDILESNTSTRQDSFDFIAKHEGKTLAASGTCTWDEEGFDTLEITEI